MADLKAFERECKAFFRPLWPGEDKILVFGEGKTDHPDIMLIGEAPGEQETLKRRPFVGKAGKNLDAFLALMGMEREALYVSNVVKIRPTVTGESGRVRNRAPSKEEIALFLPWLMREIEEVAPRALVTLGNVPLRALMGGNVTITADAHEAKALTFGFEEAAAQLKELGYTRVLVLGKDGFASCEL